MIRRGSSRASGKFVRKTRSFFGIRHRILQGSDGKPGGYRPTRKTGAAVAAPEGSRDVVEVEGVVGGAEVPIVTLNDGFPFGFGAGEVDVG